MKRMKVMKAAGHSFVMAFAGVMTFAPFTRFMPFMSPQASVSPDERAIVEFIDKHNDEAIALLERVVNINSGTQNLEGVRQVGAVFRAELDALGFKTQWVDGAELAACRSPRRDACGDLAEDPAHRPPRHGVRARQSFPEVRADRREDGARARHHRHEGRQRHHRPGAARA